MHPNEKTNISTLSPPFHSAQRIARNSFFVFLARLLDFGTAIFAIAIIARYLSVNNFGYYAFVMAITIFLPPFTDFGFGRITTREIATNKKLAGIYLGSTIIFRIFLSIIIVLVICAIVISSNWSKEIILALFISMLSQLFFSMGMLAIDTFRAFEKMEYELLINCAGNIVYLILLYTVITLNLGFISIFVAKLIANIIQAASLSIIVMSKFVKPTIRINLRLLKYLFREAAPLGIFALLLTASFKVDVFVLKYFKGPQEVALFEAAHRVIMQLQIIPISIAVSIFPHFSRLAKKIDNSLQLSFYNTFKLFLIISLPLPILLIFASNLIILVLFGNEFIGASIALKILAGSISFLFLISLQSFVLTSMRKQILNTLSAGICFLINLLLDFILVPVYGYLGASVATMISYTVFFIISFYFVSKSIGIPPLAKILPKPMIGLFGMLACCLLFYKNMGDPFTIIIGSFTALFVYLAIIFYLNTFSRDELTVIKNIFLRVKTK